MRIVTALVLVVLCGGLTSCNSWCDCPSVVQGADTVVVQGADSVVVQGGDSVLVQGGDSVVVQGADSAATASGMGRRIVLSFPGQTRRSTRLAAGDTVIVLIKRRRP